MSHNISSVKLSSHFDWWVSFKLCMPICRKTFSRNFCLVHHDGESSLSFCTTRRRYDGIIGAGPWI